MAEETGKRIEVPQGTETILLVEDDAAVRELAHEVLAQFGYRVLEAGDGAAALQLCSEATTRIDLLLTDVIMPRLSGRQLGEALTAARPCLKTLFISGYTDDVVHDQGLVGDHADFLQKPFTPSALGRKVREVLDRR